MLQDRRSSNYSAMGRIRLFTLFVGLVWQETHFWQTAAFQTNVQARRRQGHPSGDIISLQLNTATSSMVKTSTNPSLSRPMDSKAGTPIATDLRQRSMGEMAILSVMGVAIATGLIYALASKMTDPMESISREGLVVTSIEDIGPNIIDAAFPTTPSEVVTGSLGEAMAGIVAAISSFFTSTVLNVFMDRAMAENETLANSDGVSMSKLDSDRIWRQREMNSRDLTRKAVTDGDFFVTQAAAVPLLESLGAPSLIAITGAVLLAAVPAELVSFAARKKLEKQLSKLDTELSEEEEIRKSLERPFPMNLVFPVTAEEIEQQLAIQKAEALESEKPDLMQGAILVDIFADLIKWLGYNVLSNDFEGRLTYNGLPLFPGLESAAFGVIAGLSARVYADWFFAVFGFGGEAKQEEVRSRTIYLWFAKYAQEGLSAAALFGVYEFAQIPAKAIISAILSRGAENCYGSQDYNLCVEAFLMSNPPGATPEAQFQALVVTLASAWQSLLSQFFPDALEGVQSMSLYL